MKKDSFVEFLKEILSFGIVAAVIVIPIRLFVAQPFIVSGESMYPTFDTGDYLIVDQLSYHLHDPQRGDVVIFRFPEQPSKFFIKRVIGLPGETIDIQGEKVIITTADGETIEINEPYVKLERDTFQKTTLSGEDYFVMGDNRLASLDSRSWGPLPEHFIVGRAFVRLLPVSEIDLLPGHIE